MKRRTIKAVLSLIAMITVFWATIPAGTRLECLEANFGDVLIKNGNLHPENVSGHEDVGNKLREADKIPAGESLLIPLFDTARSGNYRDSRLMDLAWPVMGPVTSPYGMRDGRPHEGIDIAAEEGTPILAAGAGRVVFAGDRGTYGLAVIIDHGKGLSTLYAHCSRVIAVEGDRVDTGSVIAEIGNTGRSRGPHLHLEVRSNGSPCNPKDYLPEKP